MLRFPYLQSLKYIANIYSNTNLSKMVLEPEFSPSLPFLYSLRQEIKLYIENVTEPEASTSRKIVLIL